MEAEDLIFDDGSQGQVVKQLSELLPDICVAVFTQAFIIETIYLCDLSRLVVASENSDSILEANL